MNIAIIGAGFCGLATAWYLLEQGIQVTLFDAKGVGGGASGVAAGLLHPYPGKEGRLSWKAHEAMGCSLELLDIAEKSLGRPVANREGIIRLLPMFKPQEDVVSLNPFTLLIKSGVTVFSRLYLEGLWLACKNLGAVLYQVKVDQLSALKDFDAIVVAAGHGTLNFEECRHLDLDLIKGQVITSNAPTIKQSIVGKGYVAVSETAGICHFGATYERQFISDEPNMEKALQELRSKMVIGEPIECHAGIRVMNRHSYIPIVEKINEKSWVITAMGSRGLLYHAYFAKQLRDEICKIAFSS